MAIGGQGWEDIRGRIRWGRKWAEAAADKPINMRARESSPFLLTMWARAIAAPRHVQTTPRPKRNCSSTRILVQHNKQARQDAGKQQVLFWLSSE